MNGSLSSRIACLEGQPTDAVILVAATEDEAITLRETVTPRPMVLVGARLRASLRIGARLPTCWRG